MVKRKCQTKITGNSPATITTTRVIVQDPTAGSDIFVSSVGGLIPGNRAESGLAKNKDIRIPPMHKEGLHSLRVQNQPMSKNNTAIVTPIKPTELNNMLKGYNSEKVRFLVDGFTSGFRIPYNGNDTHRLSKNLRSATENLKILLQKIQKEKNAGRMAGPFREPPFSNFICSPLGLVPKKNEGEFRTIHHLSYPKGSSVNDGIPPEHKTVQYQCIDDAVKHMIKYGKGCYFSKTDIEHAYKIVPVHPSSYHLLGFSINSEYYYDKTLPMGLSYSCNLFEQFSTTLHWITMNKLGVHDCLHVLDDFLFVAPVPIGLCMADLEFFLEIAKTLGGPYKG